MGKSTISMVIFSSYVDITRGYFFGLKALSLILFPLTSFPWLRCRSLLLFAAFSGAHQTATTMLKDILDLLRSMFFLHFPSFSYGQNGQIHQKWESTGTILVISGPKKRIGQGYLNHPSWSRSLLLWGQRALSPSTKHRGTHLAWSSRVSGRRSWKFLGALLR